MMDSSTAEECPIHLCSNLSSGIAFGCTRRARGKIDRTERTVIKQRRGVGGGVELLERGVCEEHEVLPLSCRISARRR